MEISSPNWDQNPEDNWKTDDDNTKNDWSISGWEDDVFEESVRRFKDDLNRVFCDFYDEWRRLLPKEKSFSMQDSYIIPPIEVGEEDNILHIHVELPNFPKECIGVFVFWDTLFIRDVNWDKKPLHGRFTATIPLPFKIISKLSQVIIKHGVIDMNLLRFTLPFPYKRLITYKTN
ncbi:2588_t:CDS:2 [Diversispora eburnea]|uniref:2588_t:CDS:1 n=1 Tax=Diversispora eburnea TaxID=1213867 RepID=A0A9N9B698_9GLOM|nr:2588_t:CDS:2 [Diversispora eburnea]